ncbi:biotin-dependent carboxyltransferase family protein [Oceanobacillus alkalisoli]|uniref:5-oxoprolinase subunit C family protein n=1 Tax=Oceanobacillus alkalisoli TaxID=2925113 RepID=UPI001EE3A2D7|nr:biotin-dependent carboxyltransferase family protein [Oceanobacillus alkalisoli]MCG5103225.1 biotin-dependent carboxyltransferase family protein [Oceanobacillus alkalisoli]
MNNSHLITEDVKIATIQDAGRFGYEKFGVTINGATDTYAYMVGNKLLGNNLSEPSIEVMIFDFSIRSEVDVLFCVTGCPADVIIDGRLVNQWEVQKLPAGGTLSIKNMRKGLKNYIAFAGGLDEPKILGSVSLDTVTKFGEPLHNNQKIKLKNTNVSLNETNADLRDFEIPRYGAPWNIHVSDGPDTNKFESELKTFFTSKYQVSPQSNHIGVRLDGPPIAHSTFKEVLSRGVAIGAVQVVPSGQPIILHRGRTLTAGYPVVGTVASSDLGLVGQAKPGDEIKFTYVSVEKAESIYKKQFGFLI